MVSPGTWLGITRCGRFAGLTNIRESSSIAAVGPASRGAVVSSFLTSSNTAYQSQTGLGGGLSEPGLNIDQVGGFSMLCGQFSRNHQNQVHIQSFGVISNRNHKKEEMKERKHDTLDPTEPETYGLSNSTFTNPWPKVLNGKRLLNELVDDIQQERLGDQDITERAFGILTTDSVSAEESWKDGKNKLDLLQQSVFIPIFETGNQIQLDDVKAASTNQDNQQGFPEPYTYNLYGTQKQSVIIVHESGTVRYTERTLFDWLQGTTTATNNTVEIVFDLEI